MVDEVLTNEDYFEAIARSALTCSQGERAIRQRGKEEKLEQTEVDSAILNFQSPENQTQCIGTLLRDIIFEKRQELKREVKLVTRERST